MYTMMMMRKESWGMPTPAVRNDGLTGTPPRHAATTTPQGTPHKARCAVDLASRTKMADAPTLLE